MVRATWAVACLLAVLLAAGCSKNQTVKPDAVAGAPAAGGGSGPSGQETRETGNPPSVSNAAGTARGVDTAAAEPSVGGPLYKLGAEDVIRVSVWENKDLTLDLVVRPDGNISMPLIQDVKAEGQTVVDLGNVIRQKLLAFLKDPVVSVIVLQVNAPKYYVIGNVAKPGTYSLRSDTSILQALALAGGFTQFASLRSIKLIRNADGKQEVRKVNYNKMIDEGGEGNYLLKSGDTIVVP